MVSRLHLQTNFEQILNNRNVYFQPPASVKLQYPAIVYSLKDIVKNYANNLSYITSPGYEVILIDRNPDSEYVEDILMLPYCQFDRAYQSDNLNHFVFTVYNLKGGLNDETDLGPDW